MVSNGSRRHDESMSNEQNSSVLELQSYLDRSPSPFHAVSNAQNLLLAAGFTEFSERERWTDTLGKYFVIRDGSLFAWDASSKDSFENGFRIIGAHTDSPNLRLKSSQQRSSLSYGQLSIETYGSPLLNSWLDRDLGISGRVILSGGNKEELLFHTNEPVCRIPQLAIHLDRGLNDKGLQLNPQSHLTPIWADSSNGSQSFNDWLGDQLSIATDEISAWDLMLHDTQPSEYLGANKQWIASARIDNLVSCYAAISALCDSADESSEKTPLVCLFNHEEVGSVSSAGASGQFLVGTLERLMSGMTIESRSKAFANSLCLSVDGSHANHPNYPERHDPDHIVHLNRGIVIKRNANQRYATDAIGEAIVKDLCERESIPYQLFSNRNDLSCGSTIGPTTAASLGVRTIDLGVPQLSMHSIRELCGVLDQTYLKLFCRAFFLAETTTS